MERNHSLESKMALRRIQKNKRERRNKRIFGVIAFILASILFITPLYMKANKLRECTIHSIEGNIIVVRHPNDKLYSFITDTPKQFEEDTMITVIFDELTDWNKHYYIKGVKSKWNLQKYLE